MATKRVFMLYAAWAQVSAFGSMTPSLLVAAITRQTTCNPKLDLQLCHHSWYSLQVRTSSKRSISGQQLVPGPQQRLSDNHSPRLSGSLS